MKIVVCALLAAALGGCTFTRVTLGEAVDPAAAAALAPGVSKAEVIERLGPPDAVALERGGSAFEYLYTKTRGRNLDVSLFRASFEWDEARKKVDRLRVSFDAEGRVRAVAVVPPAPGD